MVFTVQTWWSAISEQHRLVIQAGDCGTYNAPNKPLTAHTNCVYKNQNQNCSPNFVAVAGATPFHDHDQPPTAIPRLFHATISRHKNSTHMHIKRQA